MMPNREGQIKKSESEANGPKMVVFVGKSVATDFDSFTGNAHFLCEVKENGAEVCKGRSVLSAGNPKSQIPIEIQ